MNINLTMTRKATRDNFSLLLTVMLIQFQAAKIFEFLQIISSWIIYPKDCQTTITAHLFFSYSDNGVPCYHNGRVPDPLGH